MHTDNDFYYEVREWCVLEWITLHIAHNVCIFCIWYRSICFHHILICKHAAKERIKKKQQDISSGVLEYMLYETARICLFVKQRNKQNWIHRKKSISDFDNLPLCFASLEWILLRERWQNCWLMWWLKRNIATQIANGERIVRTIMNSSECF